MLPLTLSALICTLLFGALALLGQSLVAGVVAKSLFAIAAAVLVVALYCGGGNGRRCRWWRRHLAYRDIDLY